MSLQANGAQLGAYLPKYLKNSGFKSLSAPLPVHLLKYFADNKVWKEYKHIRRVWDKCVVFEGFGFILVVAEPPRDHNWDL